MALTRVHQRMQGGPSATVLEYGAMPNVDTTEAENANFAAFNDALAAMVAAGGGTVYIPDGTYYFGANHYIRWGYSSFANAGNGAVNLIGTGSGSVKLIDRLTATYTSFGAIPDPANYSEIFDHITKVAFLWADRIDNATIEGFSVYMTAGRTFGVQATGKNCTIKNVLVDGGRATVSSGGTICMVQAEDGVIDSCVEQNGYDQGYYILRSKRIRLTNNRSFNQRVGSFVIYGSTDCIVANNLVNGCSHGLTALSSDANARGGTKIQPNNLTVEGNTFLNCGSGAGFGAGVTVSNAYYGLGYTDIIYSPRIIGNYVSMNASADNNSDGINAQYCDEPIVANNSVYMSGAGRDGIGFYTSNWGVMSGNYIKETRNDGIDVYAGIGTHVINGNIVNSPNRVAGSSYGIAAQFSDVTNNTIVIPNGDSTTTLYDYGSSTFVNNHIKGDSTSSTRAWASEYTEQHPAAFNDKRLIATKSVSSSTTAVADISSLSGGYANYIFEIEANSAGNNYGAKYILHARMYSGGVDAIELDAISTYSTTPNVAVTAAISGNNVRLSATSTNTANLTITVASTTASFNLTTV